MANNEKSAQPADVLAVMDGLIADRRENPRDGEHYAAALNDGAHAIMRTRMVGLGGRARSAEQVGARATKEEAEAECDRLNGYAEARAAVAELVGALQEIHHFTREHRRCESDRVRWIAERAERAMRRAGAEPQSLAALARVQGGVR